MEATTPMAETAKHVLTESREPRVRGLLHPPISDRPYIVNKPVHVRAARSTAPGPHECVSGGQHRAPGFLTFVLSRALRLFLDRPMGHRLYLRERNGPLAAKRLRHPRGSVILLLQHRLILALALA